MEPENKITKFPAWDLDTDEIIEMEMDADDYKAMCEAEDKYAKEKEERRRELRREEYRIWLLCRDRED
jgi:hypothetical protein